MVGPCSPRSRGGGWRWQGGGSAANLPHHLYRDHLCTVGGMHRKLVYALGAIYCCWQPSVCITATVSQITVALSQVCSATTSASFQPTRLQTSQSKVRSEFQMVGFHSLSPMALQCGYIECMHAPLPRSVQQIYPRLRLASEQEYTRLQGQSLRPRYDGELASVLPLTARKQTKLHHRALAGASQRRPAVILQVLTMGQEYDSFCPLVARTRPHALLLSTLPGQTPTTVVYTRPGLKRVHPVRRRHTIGAAMLHFLLGPGRACRSHARCKDVVNMRRIVEMKVFRESRSLQCREDGRCNPFDSHTPPPHGTGTPQYPADDYLLRRVVEQVNARVRDSDGTHYRQRTAAEDL